MHKACFVRSHAKPTLYRQRLRDGPGAMLNRRNVKSSGGTTADRHEREKDFLRGMEDRDSHLYSGNKPVTVPIFY